MLEAPPLQSEPSPSLNGLAAIRVRELEEVQKALIESQKIREANGISFYRPHLKQHKFHTCLASARYLRTGNRFGKSECGIAEDLSWAIGGRLWYRHAFDILDGNRSVALSHPGGHNHPYVTAGIPQRPLKILILTVDWDKAKSVFTGRDGSYENWGKLWKLIPAAMIGKVTNGGRGDRIVKIEVKRPDEFGGGISTITFDTVESFKHNKVGAESDDWDVIHVDEPVPEKLFEAHSRGLMDRAGSHWFTCTPLDEMWINDRFCPPGQRVVKDADAGISFKNKYIITGSTYDNPYRNDRGVAEFEAELSRESRSCRILGLPLAFAGLVYKEFTYDLHVLEKLPLDSNGRPWKSFDDPPLDYTIRVAWDVHQRLPQALLCVATSPSGLAIVCKEFFFDSKIETNTKALKKWLEGRQVMDLIIDPFAVNPDPRDESTILDDLWAEELYFDKASKDLTLGLSRVSEKLLERTNSGLPTICFSPELTETLFEFSHYIYDADKNKPKDKDDHMMENLYRLVLNGLEYIKPSEAGDFTHRNREIGFSEDLRKPISPKNLLRS